MAGAELEKFYDWRQSQAMTLASACFTLSGLILSPLLAAAFDTGTVIEVWQLCTYLGGTLLAAGCGVTWHRRAAWFQRAYLETATAETEDPDVVLW